MDIIIKHAVTESNNFLREKTHKAAVYNPRAINMIKGVSGAYISLLFYQKYDPKLYQSEGSPAYKGFSNYSFVTINCSLDAGEKGNNQISGKVGVLYVDRGDCSIPKKNAKVIKTIYWQDGNPAFRLLEYVPSTKIKNL